MEQQPLGIAPILFVKYFLPNVYRESYRYQPIAIAGGVIAFAGMAWFVAAAII